MGIDLSSFLSRISDKAYSQFTILIIISWTLLKHANPIILIIKIIKGQYNDFLYCITFNHLCYNLIT